MILILKHKIIILSKVQSLLKALKLKFIDVITQLFTVFHICCVELPL